MGRKVICFLKMFIPIFWSDFSASVNSAVLRLKKAKTCVTALLKETVKVCGWSAVCVMLQCLVLGLINIAY